VLELERVRILVHLGVERAAELDQQLGDALGELLLTGSRLDWARLLRRTYGFDPLQCPHCGARLRPIAEITERETIDRILAAIGYERRSPPRARAPDRAPRQREACPPR